MNKTEYEMKYIECPDCSGTGEQLEARGYPNGYTEVMGRCTLCDGEGWFSEDDYLIMKLAGEV